ncbi:hypothetical protein LEP1GSC151_0043 [Leptospira interrogans serovar Grippotyphosa str. LT2186]|uniref:Transposase DDE domain protein n=2 Tax=Leptospira interrogans TaxID=173 RepID=A0A0E2DCR1_LEPIR|nr:hypothetical protein LEP1GSC080_0083 [Leptospira interrogans str. FPW2026]EKR57256.1 hypothetical protein LEP1GSC105_3602 [Leptospira interrogans str. UI 12758]EMG13241.1 hypothetical protein LEP1GSC151_0043 [Leptospira interrogans serovar Grippotyphosa str. LT2186]EMN84653.1 hypothetical protein LEP1GSC107_0596 [Leptospira interrogans serovar Grippotyphosa str. UI 12769]
MNRLFLKGKRRGRINTILSAAGFNVSKLIRTFFVISKILSLHFVKNLNFSGTTK